MDTDPKINSGPYIGRSMPRFEDLRLLRGAGRYSDDISLPDQVYAAFARSPHAHALVRRIGTTTARGMKGVLAVLTGADYVADGLKGALQRPNPAGAVDIKIPAFAPDKRPILDERQYPLALERVRYPGEAVAMVIADSMLAARDAAEAVEVEYQVLPASIDTRKAIGAEPIWPTSSADNIALDQDFGDAAAVDAAFAAANIVVERTFRNQRIVNAQMEPRSGVASYEAATESYTLISGNQGVHVPRRVLAECFDLPEDKIRLICPDVGGGFGLRNNLYPEQAAIVWAGEAGVGRPVKWTNDRSESFLTDYQGRDLVTTARIALTRDGRITAYQVDHVGGVGGQTVTYVPLSNAYRVATTVYDIPLMHMRCRAVLTNTVPTAPFRGAGRPEATLVLERLIDLAATQLDMDRVAIRRKNLIARKSLPYRTASGLLYDSGDFTGNMKRMVEAADWSGFTARRREAKTRGRLRGIGISNYVETPVGIPHERAEVTVLGSGVVELAVGTQSTGQGHETTFAQVMADLLGVRPEEVRFIGGDTQLVASGSGTHSDRSMRLAGTLMVEASANVVTQGKAVAAKVLDVPAAEIEFNDGLFVTPKSNRRLTVYDVAQAIDENPALAQGKLHAKATFTGRIPAYPTGCAICEVEIDPDTGEVEVVRYGSIDDAGQAINPMILHGQVHGGIVQGIGQALVEDVAYDDSGQVLTGSFMDYGMPRARMFPMFDIALAEDPTKGNPLRVKGGGEAGITPALAVVMNAIMNALSGIGVDHIDMPATPHRIWTAIQEAKRREHP